MTVNFPLEKAPIIEAILDIDCDLPASGSLRSLEQSAQERLGDKYPILDHRYMHEMQIEASREGFNHQVRQDIEAFQLIAEDRKQLVQFRRGGYSFNRLAPYTSLDDYLEDIRASWQIYQELAAPVQIRSVQLRYINRIALPLNDGKIDLDSYLQVAPRFPADAGLTFSGFMNRYVAIEKDTGHESVVVLASQAMDNGRLPIVLDNIAVASSLVVHPHDWKGLKETIFQLRALKNTVFTKSLTEKCLKLFSSE